LAGLAGRDPANPFPEIDIEEFFSIPITVEDGRVLIDGIALECAGKIIGTEKVKTGQVR
jgi:hypothetical protein